MRAGEMRQRVTIQREAETDDGHQGFTTATVTVRARIAAIVTPLSGRDLERARAIDPRASHLVALRYWQDYRDDTTGLNGGRIALVWHDDATDRVLEAVEPPREVEYRVRLEMVCKEAA